MGNYILGRTKLLQITNGDGKAYFSIAVPTTGIMKVTVSKHNFIPYQGDVQVFEFEVTIPTAHTQSTEARKSVREFNTENLHLAYTWVDVGAGISGNLFCPLCGLMSSTQQPRQ